MSRATIKDIRKVRWKKKEEKQFKKVEEMIGLGKIVHSLMGKRAKTNYFSGL
jgi:hypothetical protein